MFPSARAICCIASAGVRPVLRVSLRPRFSPPAPSGIQGQQSGESSVLPLRFSGSEFPQTEFFVVSKGASDIVMHGEWTNILSHHVPTLPTL